MPQMMPLNWLSLMTFFIIMFILFNNYNYFNFNYKKVKQNYNKTFINYNWKW